MVLRLRKKAKLSRASPYFPQVRGGWHESHCNICHFRPGQCLLRRFLMLTVAISSASTSEAVQRSSGEASDHTTNKRVPFTDMIMLVTDSDKSHSASGYSGFNIAGSLHPLAAFFAPLAALALLAAAAAVSANPVLLQLGVVTNGRRRRRRRSAAR